MCVLDEREISIFIKRKFRLIFKAFIKFFVLYGYIKEVLDIILEYKEIISPVYVFLSNTQ